MKLYYQHSTSEFIGRIANTNSFSCLKITKNRLGMFSYSEDSFNRIIFQHERFKDSHNFVTLVHK